MFVISKLIISLVIAHLGTSLSERHDFYLSKVDNLIYEKLKNPTKPEEGDPILDTLNIYLQELNHTIQCYMHNRTGQDVVDTLIEQKGPKCINPYYINDHLLESKYGWKVKELGEMYFMLGNIKMLWRDFIFYLTTKLGYEIEPLPPFFTTTIGT